MLKRGRTSRRSTGKDGWEEIPAELLYGGGGKGRVMKDDDEDSDLSDPPPVEDEDVSMVEASKVKENGVHFDESVTADMSVDVQDQENSTVINGEGEEGDDTEAKQEGEVEVKEETMEKEEEKEKEQPVKEEEEEEWIEFETIAVTKQEWEAISLQFAKSKHPDEKSLHQLIKQEVLPKVMADLEEAEKQRALEAAMANRKRSSRIALKESEREEKERDRVARLKMEERMATIRAEEAQQVAKEKEEKNLARVREERLREREERMLARERELIEKAEREMMERENREKLREMRKLKREQILANGGVINESEELQQRKEADEDSWELDCEVCGKAGINLDDDTDEIVCCETCGKWQHTECWNTFDRSIGQPIRDWEKEDFFCSTCKPPAEGQLRPRRPIKQDQSAAAPLPAASMAGLSQAKAPPNSIEASSILKQIQSPLQLLQCSQISTTIITMLVRRCQAHIVKLSRGHHNIKVDLSNKVCSIRVINILLHSRCNIDILRSHPRINILLNHRLLINLILHHHHLIIHSNLNRPLHTNNILSCNLITNNNFTILNNNFSSDKPRHTLSSNSSSSSLHILKHHNMQHLDVDTQMDIPISHMRRVLKEVLSCNLRSHLRSHRNTCRDHHQCSRR